jgi:hypothetical protein
MSMDIPRQSLAPKRPGGRRSFLRDNPSVLWFMGLLGLFTWV